MSKNKSRFVCQSCGSVANRWSGKCEACGEWNSISEESVSEASPLSSKLAQAGQKISFEDLQGTAESPARLISGIHEFDRVCGGGLVRGSALLIGGDPGIGKSTLLLQLVARLSESAECVYITGEEAVDQIRLRAKRLNAETKPIRLASTTSVRDILSTLDTATPPDVVVIDSIQTMYLDLLESAPGTVAQVRACAAELIRLAKRRGFTLLLVGHVTKDGAIAGPRVLEHMVDAVLYFEGERGHQFRILRGVKNRFGATDEIGVFEMRDAGLAEVPNPSALFLSERRENVSGSCVLAGIEGTRPLLVEIQALVSAAPYGSPRRTVVGWDSGRLAMVLAVLETRCGLSFAQNDVYLNIAGGLKITEPAADLAVAAALVSCLLDKPIPAQSVIFGEIGLSGEVRAVSQTAARLKEAEKMGFTQAIVPKGAEKSGAGGLNIQPVAFVADLVRIISQSSVEPATKRKAS